MLHFIRVDKWYILEVILDYIFHKILNIDLNVNYLPYKLSQA